MTHNFFPAADSSLLAVFNGRASLFAVWDNLPALMYVKDVAGRLLHVNRTFAETFGTPDEQGDGKFAEITA